MPARLYSDEFRERAVALAAVEGPYKAARELKITPRLLFRWRVTLVKVVPRWRCDCTPFTPQTGAICGTCSKSAPPLHGA